MRTKRSTLAGTWYPGDAPTLQRAVDALLAHAAVGAVQRPAAAIVPHAGYQYSGAVAAAAYRLWQHAPFTRVVVLAPSHRGWFRGIAVPDFDAFETPLGVVRLDPATAELRHVPLVRIDSNPFHDEHSLEIQLPFLQRVLPQALVVPLLLGEFTPDDYGAIPIVLERVAAAQTVFVISSDFTHFGWRFGYQPFPAHDAETVRTRVRALDFGAIDPVLRADAPGFAGYVSDTGITVCGRTPIQAFLTWAGTRQLHGALLAYQTSLDVTGDYEHVVSYAAVGFTPSADDRAPSDR